VTGQLVNIIYQFTKIGISPNGETVNICHMVIAF